MGVEGLVRASFDALATAEGGCGLSAERRLLGAFKGGGEGFRGL